MSVRRLHTLVSVIVLLALLIQPLASGAAVAHSDMNQSPPLHPSTRSPRLSCSARP